MTDHHGFVWYCSQYILPKFEQLSNHTPSHTTFSNVRDTSFLKCRRCAASLFNTLSHTPQSHTQYQNTRSGYVCTHNSLHTQQPQTTAGTQAVHSG